jgi:hypothetical protein
MVAGQPAFDPAALQNVQLVREGHLAVVSVNRPSKLNALDDQTIAEQSEQLQISLADRADDGMFIRRLFLATVGRLPSPEESGPYL